MNGVGDGLTRSQIQQQQTFHTNEKMAGDEHGWVRTYTSSYARTLGLTSQPLPFEVLQNEQRNFFGKRGHEIGEKNSKSLAIL